MSRVNLSKLLGAVPSPFIALSLVVVTVAATLNLSSAFSTYVSLASVGTSVGQAGDWVAPTVRYQITAGSRTNDQFRIDYQVVDEITALQQLDVYLKSVSVDATALEAWENAAQVTDFVTTEASGTIDVDVTSFADGEYLVAVIATDQEGNTTAFPDEVAQVVTVDTIAPNTPVVSNPTTGGYMTAQDSFVWSEVVPDSDQETIAYQLSVTTAGETRSFDSADARIGFDAVQPTNGDHSLNVLACDDVGNCSNPSRETVFTVDTVAPTSAARLVNNLTFSGANQIANGSFSDGLQNWETRGSLAVIETDLPGNETAALSLRPTNDQPALASTTVASSSANQVGFWYRFNQVGENTDASLLVFADETQVLERWSNQADSSEWQYLQVDTAGVAMADVTFASSGSNGQSVEITGVTTAPAQVVDNPVVTISAEDDQSTPQLFARYMLNQQQISLSYAASMTFTIAGIPDNGVVEYWAVDAAGNQEAVGQLRIARAEIETVTASEETETVEAADQTAETAPSPSVSPSPSPATDEPTIELTVEENDVQIEILNAVEYVQADYLLTYEHTLESLETIQEALQGSTQIDADSVTISDLYLGTCSDTDGVVCTPHLSVANILLEITVFDIDQNELVLTAQQ
jgi:hypothetical protein